VMSGAASESEAAAIDELLSELPTLKFAFVFFMITSSWTLLSILTAVVSENMISTTGQQEFELKLANDEVDRATHIRELQDLFQTIETNKIGVISESELVSFLSEKENGANCVKCCRAPIRDVIDTFKDLDQGEGVDIGLFTDSLVSFAKPVTKKSVIKLDAHLSVLQRQFDAWVERQDGTGNES